MTLFEEMKAYVGFTDADTEALRGFLPRAAPHFPGIVEHFYERIGAHPRAASVITGGEEQMERLAGSLRSWLTSFFEGPHDEAFYERRARIGRVHVRIGLPQEFMFTAVDVVRTDLRELVEEALAAEPEQRRAVGRAVDRLLDLELAIMLHTFREDTEQRLERAARFAAIGQLAANIAHELRNPLGVIESSVYLIRRKPGEPERVVRHLDRIGAQVDAAVRIISDLLEMARDRVPELSLVNLAEVVEEALVELHPPRDVEVTRVLVDRPWIRGEGRLLVRALVNLVDNAAKALDGRSGRVEVRVETEGQEAVLSVSDDGPGFDADALPTVFEPLVTTRDTGVGLGLALVRRIVQRHGGTATATNRPEGGAVVTLRLPMNPRTEDA